MSRRQLLRAGAVTATVAAVGVPAALRLTEASAYTVPSKMAWWYAARFGMFIHFGTYSYYGHGEWVMHSDKISKSNYQSQISAKFNPSRFSAADIVGYAKTAGMKYLVITSKHHEGFPMWDTGIASWKDVSGKPYDLPAYTPYQADLLAALKAECDKQGIVFCLYYSIMDWNHPSQNIRYDGSNFTTMTSMTARANYINDMKAQLKELITRYDPGVLWFDGDWGGDPATPTVTSWWTKADGKALYDYLIGLKPTLIVNERVKRDTGLGDFVTPEQTVPAKPLSRMWETCATMNGAWGYNSSSETRYKSTKSMLQELVRVVSRDGNYLLNIGPKGDGTVTSGSITILKGMGAWMSTYGDSIYGTTASPFGSEPSWGVYTKKSGKLFAHVFSWPTTGRLQIPSLQNTINRIYLMNNPGTSLTYTVSGGTITVAVPTAAPNPNVSVVVVEVAGVPVAGTPGTGGIVSGAVYKLVNVASGKVLDNASTNADGGSMVQWTDHGGTQQQWTVTAVNGAYTLVSKRSAKALDTGGSTADGAVLVQKTVTAGTTQLWTLADNGDGSYRVSSQASAKAVDVGNSTTNGTTIVQRAPSSATSQRWQLVRIS
jgi:alpha-L-fucosidase